MHFAPPELTAKN